MILKFSTPADRADFMSRLQTGAPDLHQQVKASYSQPTVVTVRAELSERLQPFLSPDIRVFADVQFTAM